MVAPFRHSIMIGGVWLGQQPPDSMTQAIDGETVEIEFPTIVGSERFQAVLGIVFNQSVKESELFKAHVFG